MKMLICRWYNWRKLMMWVSSTMDGNRQVGKWLVVECKALKWAKMNNGPPKAHLDESPWHMRWLWHHIHNYDDCKIDEIQMHKMHEQMGWVIWCPHLLHEVLKYDPFWHWIENVCHVQLKNNQVRVKVQSALDVVDYYLRTTFSCNSKLVWGKMCYKNFVELKSFVGLWVDTMLTLL